VPAKAKWILLWQNDSPAVVLKKREDGCPGPYRNKNEILEFAQRNVVFN